MDEHEKIAHEEYENGEHERAEHSSEEHHESHLEHEEKKRRLIRRISVFVIGVVMLVLFLSYYVGMPGVSQAIASMAISSKIVEGSVGYNSTNTVYFMGNTYSKLAELHQIHTVEGAAEFKACLMGAVMDNDYYIDDIHEPIMYEQKYNQVISQGCPGETLISLHSHPKLHCSPSEQDIKTFSKFRASQKDAMMAIMCEKDRFNFYR